MVVASLEVRFWSKVAWSLDEAVCWLWLASTNRANGYGKFGVDGRNLLAHRLAYELEVGPVPEGLQLDHVCRVRLCVNPFHLEPVTPAENSRRAVLGGEFGRHQRSRTQCPHGHPYDEVNTYWDRFGHRACRACRRESTRRRRATS